MPQLLQASSLALTTLMQVANDSQAPAAAQVRTAQSLLKFSGQAVELENVQMRLQRSGTQQPNPPSSATPPLTVERTGRSPRGHGAKFKRTKEKAIAALLSQPTVDRAAQAADINPKTLQRWMRIPRVQRLVQQPPQPIRRTQPAVPPDGGSQQCDGQTS